MKKLFCILFCLLFTAFALVGCGDVERDEWLGDGKDDDGIVIGGKYDGYPTISENVVKKTFDKTYDQFFRDYFNCTIQYVIDMCEEYLSIFSEDDE